MHACQTLAAVARGPKDSRAPTTGILARLTDVTPLQYQWACQPDLFVKLFVQSNSAIDKLYVQVVGVWRFRPPFGTFQIAYQRGTSQTGEVSTQGDTIFTKLSWVF